jgi:hypothetical protein
LWRCRLHSGRINVQRTGSLNRFFSFLIKTEGSLENTILDAAVFRPATLQNDQLTFLQA